jgi:immune inhibitor A
VRRPLVGLLGLTLVCSTVGVAGQSAQAITPAKAKASGPSAVTHGTHDLPNPLGDKQRALRSEAVQQVLSGDLKTRKRGVSTVVKLGSAASSTPSDSRSRRLSKGNGGETRYVELSRQTTDKVFTILAEFGDERNPNYPDDPSTGAQRFDGPLHNQIPKPELTDNSTVWQPDFSPAYFKKLYFGEGRNVESLKTYYERQSSGRYSVEGTVSDWVKVRYNEARYGRNVCGDIVCSNVWALVRDAANQWVADQTAAGRTDAQIAATLATYDEWDRYDVDGDGNFNEPDGYIDHFQIVHAGGDEADGDPIFGEDAIWSHRWYAYNNDVGSTGPATAPLGGTQIGDSGVWVGDYTMQAENGGLSTIAHEYGHDLGLPDHYDTAGGDNGVEWWTLMAQSRVSKPGDQGLGTRAADLGAWDKLQLGWLDTRAFAANDKATLRIGPHEYNSTLPQAVAVILPPKDVTTDLVEPKSGDHQFWSGAGNDLDNTLSREVALGAGVAELTFAANWDIEQCGPDACDYAYVEVSTDGGDSWEAIPGSITVTDEGNGIDGTSDGWEQAAFDLSAYADSTIGLRFRYQTDPAAGGLGFFVDDVAVTSGGTTVLDDGAENGIEGWEADGFTVVGASITRDYEHYYLASYRTYTSYDRYLATGPYNFGFLNKFPNLVEHFPYQDGLLVTYWDTSQNDNNTSEHPGQGLVLPVDSHPAPLYRVDGAPWRSRVQVYDAPFSTQRTDRVVLHVNSVPSVIPSQRAVPQFDDTQQYWYPEVPLTGVKLPAVGVKMRVLQQGATTMRLRLS